MTDPAHPDPDRLDAAFDGSVAPPKRWAAGIPAVAVSLRRGVGHMGARRTLTTLRALNQPDGFDCPGCAWPEPGSTHIAEFCENGVKAVAEEATKERITAEFFAEHSIDELRGRSEHWLGRQGRLTEPMLKRSGATHYEPVSWTEAFEMIATELAGLPSPDAAAFYTSGRTSNEAAFLYQLLARSFGTNNLPDCSNMCHEASGSALTETIGIGKGSVHITDFAEADLIVVVGQNPGTNHPRMLSTLEDAKDRGASIVAINPLPEAGLIRFKNPQRVSGVLRSGTALADDHLPIRINGDLAFFKAVNHLLLADRPNGLGHRRVVHRRAHQRVRRVRRCGERLRLERLRGGDGIRPVGRRTLRHPCPRVRADHRLLGDGAHPTRELGRHDSRGRQLPPAARQHRPSRGRRVPGARALQCAG